MPESTLPERVSVLEQKVEDLASLPSRVGALELQVVQLRDEMRVEFSVVRAEIHEGDEETRRYMRVLHEEVLSRITTLAEPRRRRRR
jgi:hypothetical protein